VDCTKHLLRINVLASLCAQNSGPRKDHVLETLLGPCPGLLNASGLCPKTLLVSVRLGGGAATGRLVTPHQEGERERPSNQPEGSGPDIHDAPSQSGLYIRSIKKALPCVGQLDGRLCLSPQGLRSDKAIEIKRLLPRKHVIHGPRQLMRQHGQRFGFAVFTFEFGEILFAGLVLP